MGKVGVNLHCKVSNIDEFFNLVFEALIARKSLLVFREFAIIRSKKQAFD